MSKDYRASISIRRVLDSVATRLLLLALCIVTIGMVVRYFTLISFLREDLSQAVVGQQQALASYVAHDIDGKLSQRQSVLQNLASTLPPALLAQPGALHAWLKQHLAINPWFSEGVTVFTPRGLALTRYSPQLGSSTFLTLDPVLLNSGRTGDVAIGRPRLDPRRKIAVLSIVAPIKNRRHQVTALLVGTTALSSPGFLDSLMPQNNNRTPGGLLLVSPRDRLMVTPSVSGLQLSRANPALTSAAAPIANQSDISSTAGETVIASAAVPSTGWRVVAYLPGSIVFSAISKVQHFFFKNAALAIVAFTLITGCGLLLVFRPLFHAARHADRMTRGELPLEPLPALRNDEVGHLIAAFNRLLSKLRHHQAELARMAHHDPLTGLPNRMLLSDRLQQVLAQAKRKQTRVGLLFLDLDGFKQINDTFGHKAGDEALRQIAQRLNSMIRQEDTLARIGGDEFVLLLSDLGVDAQEAVNTVAAKCIQALDTPIKIADQACLVGVSIGIAIGNQDSTSDALLQAADRAMYLAKKTGRGGFLNDQFDLSLNPGDSH
jgi:diguanylate cyclase (GGDEF)-like protein